MARGGHKRAPDQPQRDAAVAERGRNVLIDAGAGTGKTTILVDRLLQMVAPDDDAPAIPIDRLAAITFTRKAAGELRLKIRERLLQELAAPGAAARATRLRDALAGLDTAYVGTIHSFADRLLRLKPVEAALSPSYEIAEDGDDLVHETFETLLHTVQNGTLATELASTGAAARADEATRTLLFALQVGLPAESREREWAVDHGLDALVGEFIGQRDIPPPDAAPAPFDVTAFRAAVEEVARVTAEVRGASVGARWLAQMGPALARLRAVDTPSVLFAEVSRLGARAPGTSTATRKATFDGDHGAWKAWNRLKKRDKDGRPPLWDELCAPLHRWMATQLVRLFPVVIALYDKVKARRQALDQLDLLARLRDLLARNRAVRGELQGMFDHVFVDEFQDTDPLQAEVVLFLCERAPVAERWEDVVLRDGALTLVGDPKQSIYRFRRADVAMYDRVRCLVAAGAHLPVTLSANFRSAPPLIRWLNDRFARILGASPDGRPFDAATGRVFQQPLAPGREAPGAPAVHVLPFDFDDALKHTVDEYRKLEGEALARYLRWLVTQSDVEIEDPVDHRRRRPRYGDIAVLAISTWRLTLLFPWLDAGGIPYASRGGRLFLSDPLHRQFMLGLRALADRDDGVAEAALLRPPFFSLDLIDLVQARRRGVEPPERVRQAREVVRALRQERFGRPPGATARDLLERTAFARAVAGGANGVQRLARVRELCLLLEQMAATEGLDYEAATAWMREWVDGPVQLDPPHPVGTQAVHVLTVHQAKGLEFPVVVLWDGKGQWNARVDTGAWRMERDRRGWAMNLKGLKWEEPAGLALRDTERRYLEAERRRVVYVAATRARDLFVVPCAGTVAPDRMICSDLIHDADAGLVRTLEPYRRGLGWARESGAPPATAPADAATVERDTARPWAIAGVEAARPRFAPAGVSDEAHAGVEAGEPVLPVVKRRPSRFGDVFGSAVHHAIGAMLQEPALGVREAVRRAGRHVGLTAHIEEAAADVERALAALGAEGIAAPLGAHVQVEYPVAGLHDHGVLLGGYIDLVAVTAQRLVVIDFKTDAPPAGPVEATYPAYVRQVAAYARLLGTAGIGAGLTVRYGLLFTADGVVRWCSPGTP
ncbi:MAG TPA: UvrD-helicase domain-containing protein [Candidatus Limnocylindria bacterium]|nr:UvrD-helicase domain-containing protein [Candidatus Limnocylindria bacterium]